MKRFLAILILVFVGLAVYWAYFRPASHRQSSPKMTPIALKRHSEKFNTSVDKMVGAYLDLKNAFVEDDTTNAKKSAALFVALIDSIPLEELKKDTAGIFETAQSNIVDIKANVQSLIVQPNITEMRHDFNSVTQMMYPSFFKSINYEGPTLYLQNCPMAFGEEQPADWISSKAEVENPYLGKNHPEYKATMLHCGSVKDSIQAKP